MTTSINGHPSPNELGPRKPKAVLLCMPWASTTRPSLALGILASLCHEAGVSVTAMQANMDMTALVGFETAGEFANRRGLYGLSEHLFACDMFGPEVLSSDLFIETLLEGEVPAPLNDVVYIRRLRDEVVGEFLDRLEARVLAEQPTFVGFTATFNQVMASLALAKRLKRVLPEVQILVGGACFDDVMGQEYHRAMPDIIDHVFMGEAEESFRVYLRRHMAGEAATGIPGVTYMADGQLCFTPGRCLPDMNQSPMPDYDGFFLDKDRNARETGRIFNVEYLPFESSRGCWWGQKSHCVFCGLNTTQAPYREKDVDRAVRDAVSLAARYRTVKLAASDWIISRHSRGAIFEQLKALDLDLEFFYETRADLSKEEISLMHDAGVVSTQPGIESLSTEVLKLMRKGTTRIRQVQFLRWCKEYGIYAAYNVLAGFPGEKGEWYREMADFLPRIYHLQPPQYNLTFVEMHRYSVLFEQREQFAVTECQAREDYGFNFPPGTIDLNKIAYFFSYKSESLAEREEYEEYVRAALDRWSGLREAKQPPVYEYTLGPGFLRLTDTRHGDGRYLTLAGLHHDILLLCDRIQSLHTLHDLLEPLYPREIAAGELEKTVQEMLDEDVLMGEGNHLLSLPIARRPRTTAALAAYVLGTPMVQPAEAVV